MATKLKRTESQIAVAVMTRAPVEQRAKTFSFDYKGGCGDQTVISVPIHGQADLHLLFSLGADAEHIFLLLTDGEEAQLADVVGRLEDYAATHPIALGDTFALDHTYLRENGRVALLLLEPSVANLLASFPNQVSVNNVPRACYLVVPLDAQEYETKKTQGLPHLLQQLQTTGRDLVGIRAGHAAPG